jgi:hypothetical protein
MEKHQVSEWFVSDLNLVQLVIQEDFNAQKWNLRKSYNNLNKRCVQRSAQ